jgi:short-subunit dehydrogenase
VLERLEEVMGAGLDHRAVVVVGAAGGLGSATARRLAREGARLMLADVDEAELARLVAELRPGARFVAAARVDVADWESVAALVRIAESAIGPVDAVVNCAAVLSPGRLDTLAADALRREVEVNLMGTMFPTRAFLPGFRARHAGHFVHLASLGGIAPMPRGATYSATKFGVRGFCLAMDLELRGSGVRVSTIAPDSAATPMLAAEAAGRGSPLSFSGRVLHPDEVAAVVVRTLRRPAPEVMVPAVRGWLTKLVNLSPRVMAAIYPWLHRDGERGRHGFLRRLVAQLPAH